MSKEKTNSVTVEDIESALQERRRLGTLEHNEEIAALAMVVSGVADDETRRQVEEHLAVCEKCRNMLSMFDEMRETEEAADKEDNVSRIDRRRPRKRLWQIPLAAAALFVGALSLFLLTEGHEASRDEGRFTTKGSKDDLVTAVRRGDRTFVAHRLEKLREGDNLGFFYNSEKGGYLAVLNRDAVGEVATIYPGDSKESARISAGTEVSIADGAVVEAGTRCEWIIAVFSDNPIPLKKLEHAVKNSKETTTKCGLSVGIDAARTVVVLPFLR